jgi:hypothetical protein
MLKWRRCAKPPEPEPSGETSDLATVSFPKFYNGLPSAQAAVDIFRGRWASILPDVDGKPIEAGDAGHFTMSPQPGYAAAAFGGDTGRLDGFRTLDLGPLEGGLSYGFEQLGCDVLAVEGNAEAYLKCLIAKEILGMKAKFVFGDFVRYLDQVDESFDLIVASGVLYHMVTPLKLIDLICRRGARVIMWTHYYDPDSCEGYEEEPGQHRGFSVPHFRKGYGDRRYGRFWGGLAKSTCWLRREDILAAYTTFGFSRVEVVAEDLNHPHGPCFTVVGSR